MFPCRARGRTHEREWEKLALYRLLHQPSTGVATIELIYIIYIYIICTIRKKHMSIACCYSVINYLSSSGQRKGHSVNWKEESNDTAAASSCSEIPSRQQMSVTRH